jgi:hypothetical protein
VLRSLLAIVVAAGTARAEPQVVTWTREASDLADQGKCDEVVAVAEKIRTSAPDFYAQVTLKNPAIARCVPADESGADSEPALMTQPVSRSSAKDPAIALWWSLGVTAAGGALIAIAAETSDGGGNPFSAFALVAGATAVIVGPTTGHAYAGRTWSAWLGVRLLAIAAPFVGYGIDRIMGKGNGDFDLPATVYGFFAGVGIYAIGTVGEIASAPYAAVDANREAGGHVSIVPLRVRGGVTPGLAYAVRF